jgi:hypothetical protein
MKNSRQAGFTLIEVTIVAAALVPILMAVLGTTQNVQNTVSTLTKVSQLTDQVDSVVGRMGRLTQKSVAGTMLSRATAADVAAMIADPLITVIPAVGDWIVPLSFLDRTDLSFRTVSGLLNINASDSIGPYVLEFVLDPGETANGVDDDGDGLVDEGDVWLRTPAAETTVLHRVELFKISVIGASLRVEVRAASTDSRGRIRRVLRNQVFHIRNI